MSVHYLTQDTVRRHFDSFRSNLLLVWICSNAALVITWTYFDSIDKYLLGLFIGIGCFNTYRLLGSICFLIYTGRQYLLLKCCLCCGCLKRNHDRETAQIMATVDSV
jgi:chitin synthase